MFLFISVQAIIGLNFLTHGILLGPTPGGSFVFGLVSLVHVSNLRNQGVVRVWVRQKWANWKQNLKCNPESFPTLRNINNTTCFAKHKPVLTGLGKPFNRTHNFRKKTNDATSRESGTISYPMQPKSKCFMKDTLDG